MEKIINNNEFILKDLQEKVLFAKQNAPDLETIQLKSINKANESEVALTLQSSTITVKSLFEFGLLMEILGLSEDEIQDQLSHENAHANKAQSLGAEHLGYKITLVKSDGGYLYQPHAHVYIPDEWTSDKIKETMRQVLLAPDEYGNSLSPDDEDKLNNI